MKMTRLEWRYLQKVALDHPYFDTHKLPLTEKEAKAIVEANNRMTGREFVDSIYAKLGMTRPEEKKDRFAWLHNIGELFTVPPIRKIAIAVLVVVMMTVFFAATPTGRAIAESVIQYFATLFDDGRLSVHQKDNEAIPVLELDNNIGNGAQDEHDDVSDYVYLDSFEDFIRIVKKVPVTLSLPYTELYYFWEKDIDYLVLNATYETTDGIVITYQIWNAEELISSTSNGYTLYDANESIYYSIEEDGRIIIKKILEDSIVELNAEGNYTLDELVGMLENR